MRRKIFLYYVVLIVIGMSITGIFTSEITQRFYKFEVEHSLTTSAILLKNKILENTPKSSQEYLSLANDYSKTLNDVWNKEKSKLNYDVRTTLIDYKGKVLGDSSHDIKTMENHLYRKEVQEAIHGQIGKDIRSSATMHMNYLYIAVPIPEKNVIARLSVPLVQINIIQKTIWEYTIAGIILGLILTTLLALKFSSSLTSPINQLISVSSEITKGNYKKRVSISGKHELKVLAETFNRMASELEHTVADLKDQNMKVDTIMNSMISGIVAVDRDYNVIFINNMAKEMFSLDPNVDILGENILTVIRNSNINDKLKDTIELNKDMVSEIFLGPPEDKVLRIFTSPIKQKHELKANSGGIVFIQDITKVKKLEQIRTEFVSNVTHELKTPLTSIRGFIETLRSGAIDDKEVADKFLEIIDIEAERLYTLINDILQLAEIESGQQDSNISTYYLGGIVDEVVSVLEPVAQKKNVSIEINIPDKLKIVANRNRIKQMLINLIENGIKYNNENGKVIISARKSGKRITISIKDTGIGIPEEHISRIFERFYRVDKGRSRKMGGTGLGLSIVKHIVNLYNGDIKVISEVGKGTEFLITLPI